MAPRILSSATDRVVSGLRAIRSRRLRAVALSGIAALTPVLPLLVVMQASAAPVTGVMVLSNRTVPRGAVFIAPDPASPNVGHWWISDGGGGTAICRVDAAPALTPPWTTSNCNGTAKSGGQIVVGNTPTTAADGSRYVYIADDGSKSTQVVRYRYRPAGEDLGGGTIVWNVANPTAVGGGTGGGRPVGLALAPNGVDLYVAYLKSGDVMRIAGAGTTASGGNVGVKIGSTSDGRGVNSLVMFKNDLYLGELGGLGLSRIADPSGVNRAACTAAAPCTAVTVPGAASISSFPGGMTTDGTRYLYVADAPGITGSIIKRWDPATGVVDVVSQSVQAYFDAFNNRTQTSYTSAMGLGRAPNGDLYVGDDPTVAAGAATVGAGHVFRIPGSAQLPPVPTVSGIAPTTGSTAGGDVVTITGTNFDPNAVNTSVFFGTSPATNVACASVTTCTATSPAGTGAVDVTVSVSGQPSAATAADQFTYVAPPPANGISVSSVAPASGAAAGGTTVTVTGTGFDPTPGATTMSFGATAATSVSCASTTTCTALSPAGTGTVDVQVTAGGSTSPTGAADRYAYVASVAKLYAWGITAPKGGAVWLPGNLGGHWWSSDHAQGLCRQDPVAGTTLHAINFAACADDIVGSAGQAVYDPRPFPAGAAGCPATDTCHYVYVPDNAVKSVAVWRLVYDATTETMPAPAEGMIPLADVRTLKPNGMALGPLDASGQPVANASLFVTDLTEMNIRQITAPEGDPRLQTVSIVAQTGDARGANGTIGFIGNRVFVSENRGTSYFDVTAACTTTHNCVTTKVALSAPAAGVFVAGTATDPVNGYVYVSDSPGGANATIYRFNAGTITDANPAGAPAPVLVTDGQLPAAGSPNATVWCATTCTRPWDFANHPTVGGTSGFAFAFGLAVGPAGELVITEDPTAGARSGHGTMWVVPFTN